MLRKPGTSASSGQSKLSRSSRRTSIETPEDIVRKSQRLPHNKKCADCSTKLPQVVNLTYGSFVCMACSGVHREFNHRVKGIGHSSFTMEEAQFIHSKGNDVLNATWMSKYDPNSPMERLRPPTNNNDLQLLRVWIRRKYIEKAWLKEDEEDENMDEDNEDRGKKDKEISLKKKKATCTSKKYTVIDSISDNVPTIAKVPAKIAAQDISNPSVATTENLFDAVFDISATTEKPPIHDPFSNANNPSNATEETNDDPFEADFDKLQSPQRTNFDFANFDDNAKVIDVRDTTTQVVNGSSNSIENKISNTTSSNGFANFGEPAETSNTSVSSKNQFPLTSSNNLPSFNPQFDQKSMTTEGSLQKMESQESAGKSNTNDAFADFSQPSTIVMGIESTMQEQSHQGLPPYQAQQQPIVDPFDAFNHLAASSTKTDQLPEPAETIVLSENQVPSMDDTSGLVKINDESGSKPHHYKEGEEVVYLQKDGMTPIVKIIKLHFDDTLEPFYTIQFPTGFEKQTDNSHLMKLQDVSFNQSFIDQTNENNLTQNASTIVQDYQSNGIQSKFSDMNGGYMNDEVKNESQMSYGAFEQWPLSTNKVAMEQLIENYNFEQLLTLQQVITEKMKKLQIQTMSNITPSGTSKVITMNNNIDLGLHKGFGDTNNQLTSLSTMPSKALIYNSEETVTSIPTSTVVLPPSLPPSHPLMGAPPPPPGPPPSPPQTAPPKPPQEELPIKKEGNPFDVF